ncbi:hypothetical protein [Candidatus Uabimicrobium sp. HlEnr_7]|uniref:hypothetical protein n=1 Tax=Candidatus Uabimicrobium helgolandensis TaxID=3095367 RepID=UPI0035588017
MKNIIIITFLIFSVKILALPGLGPIPQTTHDLSFSLKGRCFGIQVKKYNHDTGMGKIHIYFATNYPICVVEPIWFFSFTFIFIMVLILFFLTICDLCSRKIEKD